jgi:hypothetical protein
VGTRKLKVKNMPQLPKAFARIRVEIEGVGISVLVVCGVGGVVVTVR